MPTHLPPSSSAAQSSEPGVSRTAVLLLAALLAAVPARALTAFPDRCGELADAVLAGSDFELHEAQENLEQFAEVRLADRCAGRPGLAGKELARMLHASGLIRWRLGDREGAAAALDKALKADPDDAGTLLLAARVSRNRPREARSLAERAARASGDDRGRNAARRLSAEISLDLGDAEGARSVLAEVLKSGEDLEALRTMVWSLRNDKKAARPYAERACASARSRPLWHRAAALRLCARILLDAADPAGAYAALEDARAADPDDLNALQLMVRLRRRLGSEPPPSEPALTDAGSPGVDAGTLENLRRNFEEKPSKQTVDAFAAAIQDAPAWLRADAHRVNAEMRFALGDEEAAVSALDRAVRLDPNALRTRGLFARVPEDFAEQRLEIIDGHLNKFRALAELADPEGALAALEGALTLFPDNLSLLDRLAGFLLSRGRAGDAAPVAQRAFAVAEERTPADALREMPGYGFLPLASLKGGARRTAGFDGADPALAKIAREGLEKERARARATLEKVRAALN